MEDIFEYAKKMELDGIEMYTKQAAKTKLPGIKKVLMVLIEEEQKHYEIFDAMQKNGEFNVTKIFSLDNVKNVFQQMKDSGEGFDASGDEIAFYKKALEIEQKSEAFYRAQAMNQVDPAKKEALNSIADEEHRHGIFMDNMVHFLSQPKHWVENAEFNHMQDY
ncbi:MAG: ferritin family protein [Nanoarchaeota archaeon]|nr:ferritin family protein [Nanoarchaeota archaeon]MBU1704014.1 ferritin family protein [Nanoarchaeota archaeon]